jgi:membrane-associated phospholipid phosphatase
MAFAPSANRETSGSMSETTALGSKRAAEPSRSSAAGGPEDRLLAARHALSPDSRFAGHPVLAFVAVALAGFAVLAAVTVFVGWLLQNYVLPDHGIGHADEHVNVWLAQRRTPTRNDVSFWMSGIGDVYAIPALVALTAIGAMILRKWRVAAFIVTAIALEAATYRVATWVIQRERPQVHRLDHLPADASYYSGHTAASVAVYCGLALLITSRVRNGAARTICWVIAIAIPVMVALSRMYRGMHHPTDVAAAALVGIAVLVISVAAARAADAAGRAREAAR